MSIEEDVQIVKDWFAALGSDMQRLLALSDDNIEWIIPGEDWPQAGTHRGRAGLTDLLRKASELETDFPQPLEFVAQGDRVFMIGFARGRIKATNKTFEDDFVFAITVKDGKLTNIRESIDTQALARASVMDAGPALAMCCHRRDLRAVEPAAPALAMKARRQYRSGPVTRPAEVPNSTLRQHQLLHNISRWNARPRRKN